MANDCKMCLLREIAGEDIKKIEKYKEAIRPEDRVSEEKYEERLMMCKKCDNLNAGTCYACGCYVELRALGLSSRCPHKLW